LVTQRPSVTEVEAERAVAAGLLVRLDALVGQLRRSGVHVSMAAVVDAAHALEHVDIARRREVAVALRSTLVKRPEDLPVFDTVFARLFPAVAPAGRRSPVSLADEPLTDAVRRALIDGDRDELHRLAERAVEHHAGMDRAGSERYHLQRVLRQLNLSALVQEALRGRRQGERGTDLDELLARHEITELSDELRRALLELIREVLSDNRRQPDAAIRLEDLDVLGASTSELWAMRRAVEPLARKLANKLGQHRRRHARRGRLDTRRTIRRSLGQGGVPLEPQLRRRMPHRPALWLLCDVSGSVAEFSRFTLALVQAVHSELPRTRSFTFVDRIDEVTELLARAANDVDPFMLLTRASARRGRKQSDYGMVFAEFWARHGHELAPTATVLITGDGRSHGRDPGLAELRAIADRVRRVYWFDPEHRAEWTEGDAAIADYAPLCDAVFEVRNLAQLTAAVESVVNR
jgi:uncharacterized protein with von Willebrand factor type A (vWA) domain